MESWKLVIVYIYWSEFLSIPLFNEVSASKKHQRTRSVELHLECVAEPYMNYA